MTTPRERFLTALRGGMPDRIPMVLWNAGLPDGDVDTRIFDLDVCLVVNSSVWKPSLEGIGVETREEPAPDGDARRHTIFHTPAGDLSMIERPMHFEARIEKYPFSGPGDYDSLEALISGRRYEPDFEGFRADDGRMDERSIARPESICSPMDELICEFMGAEAFRVEYAERRERLLYIERLLKEDWRRRVEMTAASPARYAVIEGSPGIGAIGPEYFEWYCHPCIEEACARLHEKDILAGANLAGNNRLLAPLIARTSLDLIESFTPGPETDMSLGEAREAWPGKALQMHFPGFLQREGKAGIEAWGRRYLGEVSPGGGFVVGQSREAPDRGGDTLISLFRFFHEHGALPLAIPSPAEQGRDG